MISDPVFLLDTNIVSFLRKPRVHPALRAWLLSVEPVQLRISVATLTEIRMGIERARRSGNEAKADEIEDWLGDLSARHQVEPLSPEAAILWGRMLESPLRDGSFRAHAPKPRTSWTLDLMIASIAIATGAVVVTNNMRDFERIGAMFELPGVVDPSVVIGEER